MKAWVLALSLVTLMACDGGGDTGAVSGGLTAGEAAQLEKAAERIDAMPPGPGAAPARALEEETAARLADERDQLRR